MEHLNTLEVNHYGIKPLAISPDGRLLISGSSGSAETREYSYIDVWSLPNGNHLTNITIRVRGIKSAVISPDSRVLIIGDTAGNIRFWDLSNKDITINDFTPKNIIDIESKINTSSIEESLRDALKFTLALIRLRQQFDIDIEDSSNDIQFSEFDIEIEG
jgi:WD40 repeat protein